MAHDHDGVTLDRLRFEPIQQRGNGAGRHPRGGRRRPRQKGAPGRHPGTLARPPAGRAPVWDASSVAALDAVTTKYVAHGKHAGITGLNEASTRFHENLSGKLGADH
jgi:hypothetical protein